MFDAGRFRIHHRTMLVVAAVSLFLLVGLVGVVLVNGSSSSPVRSSNVSAECDAPTGPTARGYGETGTGVTPADPDCHSACGPSTADGPTARGYGESGAASVAPSCVPCPNDPPGATSRGYGESGVGSVLSDECGDTEHGANGRGGATVGPAANDGGGPTSAAGTARAPLTGGGGTHGGAVPGATGRAGPRSADAAEHGRHAAGQPLSTPLSAAVVAQAPGVEGGRKNTALVVGGLVLLLVAVAVVLRRGRPGSTW